jgi:hypothetical protein
MARIRSIHPTQWTDEEFVSCSAHARLLAIGLRNEADDNGVFEWKPITLKMRLLPADNLDVEHLLSELIQHRQVHRYETGGKQYGIIRNFHRYQRPKKPNFTFPTPEQLPTGYELHLAYKTSNSPPVGNRFGTGGEKSFQRKEEGGREEKKDIYPALAISEQPNPEPKKHDDTPEGFEEFYQAYPLKKDPDRARKAYRAARKRASAAELLEGAATYARECQGKDKKYIKHPSTWLNAGSWKNETEPPQPAGCQDARHERMKEDDVWAGVEV